jgi:hypothetical protein
MIGLLVLTAIPTVTGVAQGVSQQRAQNAEKADEKRMAKFYIDAKCETKSSRAKEVQGKRVVLRDGKVSKSAFGASIMLTLSRTGIPLLVVWQAFIYPQGVLYRIPG